MDKKQADFYDQSFKTDGEGNELTVYDCLNRHERRKMMKMRRRINVDSYGRETIMIRQKKIRNIKYKDIYSLDSTIARFILLRLKFFRKKICSCPYGFTLEEWKDILDKMILAFELILDKSEPNFGELKFNTEKTDNGHWKMVKDPDSTFNTEAYIKWHIDRQKTIEEGLKLFTEYFQDLWI